MKTTEMGSCKQQRKPRPTQTRRAGCTNNMRPPVYLQCLLAFVLSSPSMGFLGSGDGLFASSSRITLRILELCCSLMPLALHQPFLAVLLSPCATTNFSVGQKRQFQSICGRRDRGISTVRTTRSAGLWIIILLLLSGNIHANPGPELID